MTNISLKQIEVFVKVAELGSFTWAAKELFLTQSTISVHISSLEEALDVELFSRQTRRQVRLTPEGEKLYPQAKKILAECMQLEELAKKEDNALPLQLGASTVPGQYLLPAWMAEYLKKVPECRYNLRRGDSAAVHQMIQDGDIRMGFVGAKLSPDNMEYIALAEDRLVMVTPNNPHYQGCKKKGMFGKDLLGEPTVARELGSGTERSIQNYMSSVGFPKDQLNIVARVEDPETIKNMVSQGLGVSVLSYLAVEKEVNEGKLLAFDLDEDGVKREVYLIYRKGESFSKSEQRFIRYCEKLKR